MVGSGCSWTEERFQHYYLHCSDTKLVKNQQSSCFREVDQDQNRQEYLIYSRYCLSGCPVLSVKVVGEKTTLSACFSGTIKSNLCFYWQWILQDENRMHDSFWQNSTQIVNHPVNVLLTLVVGRGPTEALSSPATHSLMALPTELKICISLATSWGVHWQWTVWFTQQPVSQLW